MSETTPTPWEANDEVTPEGIWIYAWQGPLKVSPAIATGKADAALIVTAVNAHQAMKDALAMVRDADEDCKRDGFPTIPPIPRAKIDAALRLADGGTE